MFILFTFQGNRSTLIAGFVVWFGMASLSLMSPRNPYGVTLYGTLMVSAAPPLLGVAVITRGTLPGPVGVGGLVFGEDGEAPGTPNCVQADAQPRTMMIRNTIARAPWVLGAKTRQRRRTTRHSSASVRNRPSDEIGRFPGPLDGRGLIFGTILATGRVTERDIVIAVIAALELVGEMTLGPKVPDCAGVVLNVQVAPERVNPCEPCVAQTNV